MAVSLTPEQKKALAGLRDVGRRSDSLDPAAQRDLLTRLKAFHATLPDDPTLQSVADTERLILEVALDAGAAAEVADLAQARAPGPPQTPDDDAPGVDWQMLLPLVAVLGHLGRPAEAVALMERSFRWGNFHTLRFKRPYLEKPHSPMALRDIAWLKPISDLPAYRRVIDDHAGPFHEETHETAMIRLVQDATLGGSKRKRCGISGEMISPGDPIVRWRPLHGHLRDAMEMASASAFAASPMAELRQQLETNTIPAEKMFPWPPASKLDTPIPIMAFRYDVGRNPGALDLARAVRVLAQPGLNPRAMGFKLGPNWFEEDPPTRIHSNKHGFAGDLLWMLIRCGLFEDLLSEIRALPRDEADQVMALCAAFGDAPVRAAAATYFDIPDLPFWMDKIFTARARPKTALEIADFGTAHPRFRQAMARACEAYSLHLYSGYVPCPNWYFDGWAHLTRGHNTSLMSLFLDHPEELAVLRIPIARKQLPTGLGGTMAQEFANCRGPIYQAILLSQCRTDPDGARFWADPPPEIARLVNSPPGRAARKMADKLLDQAA